MLNALLETFSCVYSETMLTIISFFQKLIKGGWNKGGGLENFSKINKRGGGRLFSTREYAFWQFWSKNCQTSVIPAKKPNFFQIWSLERKNLARFVQRMPLMALLV